MHRVVVLVTCVLLAGVAVADLQNVQVGMQLEMRGRWYHNAFETGNGPAARPSAQLRIPSDFLTKRPIGQAGNNVLSLFRYSDWGNDWAWCEQTAAVSFSADFTDNVKAMVEFYDFWIWGEDFRSNYLTGIDARANTADDIELLQAYIETNEVFGQPLRLRFGRQQIQFGKDLNSFLLAAKTTPTQRFAYDGIRATYKPIDKLTIDAWWTKLAENSPVEEDGDVDFYGAWANYKFGDPFDLSLFWMWLRDKRAITDTNLSWIDEEIEDLIGWDDYEGSDFHTVGFEAAGKVAQLDYLVRAAYQFGDAGQMGSLFKVGQPWLGGLAYGDDGAEYDNFGMDATVGYTIPSKWNFRPYLQAVWYEGEDDRDISFTEWLNPFHKPKASVSFNRLFSDINYCPVINDNADLTNFRQLGGGVTMTPTEKLWWAVRAYNTWADEPFSWPAYFEVPQNRWLFPTGRVPFAPGLSFWDEEGDDNLGFSMDTILKYTYSSNLTFLLYYGHLFAGDGLKDGHYISYYGTMMNGGLDDKDADYVFLWSILKF